MGRRNILILSLLGAGHAYAVDLREPLAACWKQVVQIVKGGPRDLGAKPRETASLPRPAAIQGKALDQLLAETAPDFREFTPKPYRYAQDVAMDGERAFRVGGENSDEAIARMRSLTGLPLETLNQRARPVGATSSQLGSLFHEKAEPHWEGASHTHMRKSGDGFMSHNENVRDLLLKDNRRVRELGLTHQKVARPILDAMKRYEQLKTRQFTFEVGGKKYKFEAEHAAGNDLSQPGTTYDTHVDRSGWGEGGVQGSFFNDNLFANYHMRIRDLTTGKTLELDALTPHLIHRYGFYQGGLYRTPPERIAEFFRLK